MSERSIEHGAFVVDRVYAASPDRVFAAWSDPQAKARWLMTLGTTDASGLR
jgi:uncharacterized protein YndB with AHSA1/START domain